MEEGDDLVRLELSFNSAPDFSADEMLASTSSNLSEFPLDFSADEMLASFSSNLSEFPLDPLLDLCVDEELFSASSSKLSRFSLSLFDL